jgi:hypothetical protein
MKLENKNFKLNIVGTFDAGVTESEVANFEKSVWPDICRSLDNYGLKTIQTATLDAAGKHINLPAKTGATV